MKVMEMSKPYLFAAGLAATMATTLPAWSQTASSTPLASAKTIQVHETILQTDKSGKLAPAYSIDVRIARPGSINALITDKSAKAPDQYVAEDKTEKEYRAKGNTVRTLTTAENGMSLSMMRRTARIDLILASGQLPALKKGERTVTTETVNNIPMTVTTDVLPAEISPSGESFTPLHKLWVITATGQPYRYTNGYKTGDKTATTEDVSFTDWRIDQPIAKEQMAFAPPADAKPYVEPTFAMTSLAVGAVAPDFAATTSDGKTVHLSDFKGKVVVLDFWATWCHPCQDAMPHLESVYKQVKDQNVAVLGLCVWDSKAAYDTWVTAKKGTYTFPTAFDPAGRAPKNIASELYNMNAIPTQYVIGKDGKIAAAYVGDEGHQLEKALTAQGVTVAESADTPPTASSH